MKIMTTGLVLAFASVAAFAQMPSTNDAFRVEQLLARGESLWQMTSQDFMSEFGSRRFRWTSEAKTTARAYVVEGARLAWLEYPVIEVLADFNDGVLSKITVVVFTRGDAGNISMGEFRKAVAKIGGALNVWAGVKEPVEIKQPLPVNGVKMQTLAWVKEPHQVTGEWSYSEFPNGVQQPEFIRLRLERFNAAKDPRSALKTTMNAMNAKRKGLMTKGELRKNVLREDNSDVVIRNVPMVDQGAKGYCAVATVERILSYYGLEADQHKMAQLAQSSAEGGTASVSLLAGLKRVGGSLGCRIEENITLSYSQAEQLSRRYDTEAKKQGKRPSYWTPPYVDLTRLYQSFDKDILSDLRKKDLNSKMFVNRIKEKIDQGIPLVWAVMLGIVEEKPALPQARGGHMRIIIGYNPKTGELLYTDSWGAGHELKRMSFENAWLITTEMMTITPSALVH